MKYIAIVVVFFVGIVLYFFSQEKTIQIPDIPAITQTGSKNASTNIPEIKVIAEHLDTPWAIVFLPDKSMLITERKGTVRKINSEGVLEESPVATLSNVIEIGEGGLLGMTLHPDYKSNHYIYFYYTYQNAGGNTLNRVVRMTYEHNALGNEAIIVDAIPGASNHNGGRIKFGPDNFLYITTGDAQNPSQAQNKDSLAGKILRVTDKGAPAPGNPFNNRVYSYGHRNPQGLAWDSKGNLWSTEHGRSGVLSGFDEVNLIQSGHNYGWPDIQGDETRQGMQPPIIHSGATTTWAPASLAIINNNLYFGGLRGQALYQAAIQNEQLQSVSDHYEGTYGRIREVTVGPDNMLYITTSNQDGRGAPQPSDDRLLRINP